MAGKISATSHVALFCGLTCSDEMLTAGLNFFVDLPI
jgi:hypothetical protein